MPPLFYYILFFIALGAAGMAVANKKVTGELRSERWKKFFTYILITGIVIISVFYHFFFWVALVIAGISSIELLTNSWIYFRNRAVFFLPLLIFLCIASGFILFSRHFNFSFLLFIYFQVLVFDAFCQVTGQLWGKHPLIPSVSPSKTVEGLAGGWICCIVAAVLGLAWIKLSVIAALLFGFITGLASFSGDILASFYKRKLGIKDYSNWLPGQGGFLDRFDSLLFTGFVYYILHIFIYRSEFSSFTNSIAE